MELHMITVTHQTVILPMRVRAAVILAFVLFLVRML